MTIFSIRRASCAKPRRRSRAWRFGLFAAAAALGGCASMSGPPSNQSDVCAIFAERPAWREAAEDSARKWGAPIPVQMAIIKQESSFVADARPPKKKVFFGLISWGRVSSAYGYAQALDGTWDWYLEDTGRSRLLASRDDFDDAADFVGWYMAKTRQLTGVAVGDARNQYLAYHEGQGGFRRGTHNQKQWLLRVSRKVASDASLFGRQLQRCGRPF